MAWILLLGATRAAAQGRLDRIEWFGEMGESFLRLGDQDEVYQIPPTFLSGVEFGPYQATIISPEGLSAAKDIPPILTGLEYRITARDSVEISYSLSVNRVGLQPTGATGRTSTTFERVPALTLNYARYFRSFLGWRPFVLGGAGVVLQDSIIAGLARTDPSFDFGFGADYRLTRRLALRVEARDYVERMPSPFHGYSNDIAPTAGLVISSAQPGRGKGGLSRLEVYLEGGGSFFAGRSVPVTQATGCVTPGPECAAVTGTVRNSFSGGADT